MAQPIRVGILGAGWPGGAHARALAATPGVKIAAVADLIPARRHALMKSLSIPREFADAGDLLADRDIDAVVLALPNDLHEPIALAALKAGKHVLCETPPALDARQARKLETAARRAEKVLLFGLQRRFGAAEQAARQTVEKGYLGDVFHVRAAWTRTRAIPAGTGWYTDKSRSGGGAIIDLGLHMLDLAWFLLGRPSPLTAVAIAHRQYADLAAGAAVHDVEDSATALLRFDGGVSVELACAWAINQSPGQNGALCRLHGQQGALEVYTPHGPVLHRGFDAKGHSKSTALKVPKLAGHPALARHFRDCILGKDQPAPGPADGVILMQIIDAIYKSIETGRSVNILPGERAAPAGAADAESDDDAASE